LKIARSRESSFFSGPFDRLDAAAKYISAQSASLPDLKGRRQWLTWTDIPNLIDQVSTHLDQVADKRAREPLRLERTQLFLKRETNCCLQISIFL
jgi:hypothetical protein